MNKLEEKIKENHKIKNRVMLWYVRDCFLLDEVKSDYDKLLHSVDSWKDQMSDEDIIIADMLIKSGVDLELILEFQETCYKKSKYHEKRVI